MEKVSNYATDTRCKRITRTIRWRLRDRRDSEVRRNARGSQASAPLPSTQRLGRAISSRSICRPVRHSIRRRGVRWLPHTIWRSLRRHRRRWRRLRGHYAIGLDAWGGRSLDLRCNSRRLSSCDNRRHDSGWKVAAAGTRPSRSTVALPLSSGLRSGRMVRLRQALVTIHDKRYVCTR